MLNRIAILAATPVATLLTLLLELLLSFGVGEAEIEFDTIMFNKDAVELLDDTLCNLSCLKPTNVRNFIQGRCLTIYLANPTSLLTPDGVSRQILVEIAQWGWKCLARSSSRVSQRTLVM